MPELNNQPASQPQNDPAPASSPEQTLELERLKTERVARELELATLAKETSAAEAERHRLACEAAMRTAFEGGPKFYEPALVESLLRSQHDLKFDDQGRGTALIGGRRVPLDKALELISVQHSSLVADRRTLPRNNSEPATPTKPRSEWSRQEKIDFLRTHSAEEFEALPLHAKENVVQVRTFADYSRLPNSAKIELLSKPGGLEWLTNLPRRR